MHILEVRLTHTPPHKQPTKAYSNAILFIPLPLAFVEAF